MLVYQTFDIARALGVSHRTVCTWHNRGILKSVPIGSPARKNFGFPEVEILAAALARDLRRRGFGLPQIVMIVDWLRMRTLESFQKQWHQGRTLLFCVGDAEPFPRLLCRADIFDNPAIDIPAALAAGVCVAVVDLQEAFRQLTAKLGEGIELHEQQSQTNFLQQEAAIS